MSDNRLTRLASTIDALNLRERAMLAVILVLAVWAAWQTLLMAPLTVERKSLATRIDTARSTVTTLNQSIQVMAAQRSRDPLAEQRLQLEQLQADAKALDAELASATSSLIDPQQMGAVLEAILAKQQAVTVVAITSLVPEPINPEQAAGMPPIFRHGLQLDLEGDYLDLLRFLQALDALPWEFVWSGLQLTADGEQRPRLRLTLQTLSLKRGWLGV